MQNYMTTKECNAILLSLNLINCQDEKKYIKTLYSISNKVEKNYKVFKIPKKNGKSRKIYAPNKTLKHIQRQILNNILNERQISPYAKAYHKGISLKENALPHVNKDLILKLDIKGFFENITFLDVYNACFSTKYYPKQVGILLTYLCTYEDHLTQGSPTSSYISNLVMKDFDLELGSWCQTKNISYTRYSDDLTFSGVFSPNELIIKVRKMLYKLSLELNSKKIHAITKSTCQTVTGLVVNDKLNVKKEYKKRIRQIIYYIKKFGLNSHLKRKKINITEEQYLNVLYGQILYVLQIDKDNEEFKEYQKYILKLKSSIK